MKRRVQTRKTQWSMWKSKRSRTKSWRDFQDLRNFQRNEMEICRNKKLLARIVNIILDLLVIFAVFISVLQNFIEIPFGFLTYLLIVVFSIDLMRNYYDYYKSVKNFQKSLKYFWTFWGLIDILSLVPFAFALQQNFGIIKILRLFRLIKIIKISKGTKIIIKAIKRSLPILKSVLLFCVVYVFITSFLLFSVEKSAFRDFWETLYFSAISLTTIGYGDVLVSSILGRLIVVISAFVGIGIIALPSAVITANYIQELDESKKTDNSLNT